MNNLQKGYTLIEVITVIAIISFLSLLAFYGLGSGRDNQSVANAQSQILSDLRSLQNKAVEGKLSTGVAPGPGTHIAAFPARPASGYTADGQTRTLPRDVNIIQISDQNGIVANNNPVSFFFYSSFKTRFLPTDCSGFSCLMSGGLPISSLSSPVTIRLRGRSGPDRLIIIEGSQAQVARIQARQ